MTSTVQHLYACAQLKCSAREKGCQTETKSKKHPKILKALRTLKRIWDLF